MWTVVYFAPNRAEADMVKRMLDSEGLLVNLRPVGIFQINETCAFEVIVPESEAEEAQEILSSAVSV